MVDDVGGVAPADRPARLRLGALHVVMAGVPLGLFGGTSCFDVLSRAASEPFTFPRAAFWLLVLAVISAVATGIPGLFLYRRLDQASPRAGLGRRHVLLTDAGIVAGIASLVARRGSDYGVPVGFPALLLEIAATGCMFSGAWLGAHARLRYQDTGPAGSVVVGSGHR